MALGIDWHLHIPYRPQSSGKVVRVNGIIKMHLTKLASELWLSWDSSFLWHSLTFAPHHTPNRFDPF